MLEGWGHPRALTDAGHGVYGCGAVGVDPTALPRCPAAAPNPVVQAMTEASKELT